MLSKCRRGLGITRICSITSFVVESDAEIIIKLINGESVDNSELSLLIDEVIGLASKAGIIQFSFCSRESNSLAHSLTRMASVSDDFVFFVFDPSHCLRTDGATFCGSCPGWLDPLMKDVNVVPFPFPV